VTNLAVPSVIVPRETNYLINPAHVSFKAMVDKAREMPFAPDKRL
jgi:RES domain-containing protein